MCGQTHRKLMRGAMFALGVFEIVMLFQWILIPERQLKHNSLLPPEIVEKDSPLLPGYLFFLITLAAVRLTYCFNNDRVSVWALASTIQGACCFCMSDQEKPCILAQDAFR